MAKMDDSVVVILPTYMRHQGFHQAMLTNMKGRLTLEFPDESINLFGLLCFESLGHS